MKSGSLLFISVFLMWEKGGGAVLELWGEKMCEMYQSLNNDLLFLQTEREDMIK